MKYKLVVPDFTTVGSVLSNVADDINLEDADVGVFLRLWNVEVNGADPHYYFNLEDPSPELSRSLKRLRQTGHIRLVRTSDGK